MAGGSAVTSLMQTDIWTAVVSVLSQSRPLLLPLASPFCWCWERGLLPNNWSPTLDWANFNKVGENGFLYFSKKSAAPATSYAYVPFFEEKKNQPWMCEIKIVVQEVILSLRRRTSCTTASMFFLNYYFSLGFVHYRKHQLLQSLISTLEYINSN